MVSRAAYLLTLFEEISAVHANFVVNKFWAFADPSPLRLSQVTGFAVVAVGSAFLVAGCVHVFAIFAGLAYLWAKTLGSAVVFACWSYPAQARFVFAH